MTEGVGMSTALPRLNELAPDFEALTTQGPLQLSHFQGKWVLFFSHPADFTPVCTTEFVSFARHYEEFERRNVVLLGLSVDSVYAHIAWVRNIEEKFGVKIPFPVIADIDMRVASLYGMIHPGASTTAPVRAVFVIDDKGMLRAMVYYPLSNGRSIPELLRLIDALQTTDQYAVSTPADWLPGDDAIVPPPQTMEAAGERVAAGQYQCTDWYCCKTPLPATKAKEAGKK